MQGTLGGIRARWLDRHFRATRHIGPAKIISVNLQFQPSKLQRFNINLQNVSFCSFLSLYLSQNP